MTPLRPLRPAGVLRRNLRPVVGGWIVTLGLAGLVGQTAPEPALHHSKLTLAPSARQLETLPRFEPRWVIPAPVAEQLGAFFRQAGFRPELADELLVRLGPGPDASTRTLVPDRALVGRFNSVERAHWWDLLQLHHANGPYRWPLSLTAGQLAALEREPALREAAARVRALGRSHGERLVFADLFALEDAFATPADRAAFYRVVLAGDAPVLKLRRAPDRPLDASAQAAWWQVNGRYRAIEPLLNAVAAIPDAPRLDVAHLLPRLPRSLLNTYPPRPEPADDPGVDSGLLAAEFFNLSPAIDLADAGGLQAWLERECVPVDGPPQYGDLHVFGDLERTRWPYAAVYVAGGFGFARRPTTFGPWQFLELAEIPRLNPRYADKLPRRFRPRAAVIPPGEPPFLPGRMPEAWRRHLSLKPVPPGPWGKLWYYEVLLAPSGNTLERLPTPDLEPKWTFAGVSAAEIDTAIAEIPMPAEVRDRLQALFRHATLDDQGRISVRPDLELVLAVPREFRTRLFPHLVGGDSVTDYAQHIPFPAGFGIDEWFDAGSLAEPVRQAILRLAYPLKDRVMISDLGALYALLPSRREQLSAHRAALRVPALVLLMEKPTTEDVPALTTYWRHGRAKDIGQLLESFAAAGDDLRYLDTIHLLSPIEREFVNTYFTPEGPSLTPSCFWAAFNFGAERPDDRFLVVPGMWTEHQAMAWQELQANFERLPAPAWVGDIIGYRRRGAAEVIHVCVFVADGIVFTKNGATFSKPWHLARVEDIDELYLTGPDTEKVYFRRRLSP